MTEEVQKTVQSNAQKFREVYNALVAECVARRKSAKFSQEFMADWLEVDRRKIIELEAGQGGVGLLLRYADKLDVSTHFSFQAH